MKFINAHNVMPNLRHTEGGMKYRAMKMLAGYNEPWGVQSWRQTVPNIRRCDREATSS